MTLLLGHVGKPDDKPPAITPHTNEGQDDERRDRIRQIAQQVRARREAETSDQPAACPGGFLRFPQKPISQVTSYTAPSSTACFTCAPISVREDHVCRVRSDADDGLIVRQNATTERTQLAARSPPG